MFVTRMRTRYLAAMAIPVAACNQKEPSTATATTDPTTTAATAAATASATASTAAAADTAPPPPHVMSGASMHMPRCPSGAFCVTQPRTVGADAGASSPYGMCAAQVTMPADAGAPNMNMTPYVSFNPDSTKDARAADPKLCCYTWTVPCPGGRAFRDERGGAVVASEACRSDWLDAAVLDLANGSGDRAALAERWVREAQFEHASIASFARVTLDLLAVGAPASLATAAMRAGLDEVEHARIAFSLASAFAGRSIGPGPLPTSELGRATLESVVREAIIDGCIGEAAAALALREEAARTTSPAMRTLLDRMAEDEERHAELAYATVAWVLAEDPSLARIIDEELARAQHDETRARVAREIAAPVLAAH